MALTKITSDVIGTGAVTSDHLASGAVTHSSLSSITTDNVSEGSTNTYFTNARARGSISVTGGNLSYDSGTGVIQLTTDQIRTAVSGGTGVSISAGEISIGQDVATSSTPTFGNITTTGYIAGPATFTIDPAAVGDNTGTVVIAGNLQVDGTTTTINSTTMEVDDLNITLASGAANAAAANGAGITVDCGSDTDATFIYDGTNDEWDFNKDINVTGTVTASGNITGTLATAAQPNITSVGTLTGFTSTGIDDNATTTAITIDSSENVLVGKVVANTSTVGIEARENGLLVATRDGGQPLLIDRLTDDGNLVLFRKDSSEVGSIGTKSGIIWMGSDDTGLYFDPNNDAIRAWSPTANDTRGNAIDLGSSGTKFKDLYLSGTAYIDTAVGIGTDSPNQLLHLDNSASSSDSAGIRIISGTAGSARILLGDTGYGARGRLVYDNSDDSLQLWGADSTTSAERMRIDSSGNVGIGTTDPSGILDIYKNSVMDINLRGNPPELNLEDLGGTSGQKRGRLTVDSNKLSIQGLSDDDASVTYNFVDFRLDNGGVQFYGDFPDGSQNVAFGASAGAALTSTGNRNVLLGSRAGMSVTSGDHNVFVGSGTSGSIRGAGELTDTGVENVGIGTGALGDNVSGGYNTAVGHMSMYYNGENSSSNIAVGVNAMLNGGGGGSNVAVGINALKQVGTSSGDSNTAINFEALEDLTTGNHNIGIGYRAGMNLQSGSYNIIIGNNSHNSATGGNYNIVLGYGASTATGSRNLIVGYDAGTNMTSGSNNTLINFSGDSHGIDIASKSNHTVIGGGDMMPAFHNYVHEDTAFGNIDVTHNGTSENFITAGAGATVPLFTGGNSFSGIFMINDFTRTGDMYLIMTGGGSISIIAQTGGTLVTSSSPGSLQYGIYLSSLGVMFKNGTSSSFNFRLIAFRTRAAQ